MGYEVPMASLQAPPLLLMSANSAWNIRNFRIDLVRALQAAGYRVAVAAPPDEHAVALAEAGVEFHSLPMRATGTSPLQDAGLFGRYVRLMRQLRPAAYLGFTAKPNVYGSLAAWLNGVPAINSLTGLGATFIHLPKLERLMSVLYRLALRRSEAVLFHNPDDRDLFVGRNLVAADRARVIPGSGIDLAHFSPAPFPDNGDSAMFLFVGRLLWEKGVGEFVEAARLVRQDYPHARFRMVGAIGGDRRAVPEAMVREWAAEGLIDYAGTCSDIRSFIAEADCVVLPSWREGMPRVLLEGAAMGRPSIAFDVPGCRQAIVDGATGFLSEPRAVRALAACMIRMIELPAAERRAMGIRARAHAEEHFGVERVCAAYISVLKRMGVDACRPEDLRGRGPEGWS